MYVTARTTLSWSHEEFWASTPRMFYAFLYGYVELQAEAAKQVQSQEVLVGKDALRALSEISGTMR